MTKVRALVWDELTAPKRVYPHGINGAIVEALNETGEVSSKAIDITMPEQGLSKRTLATADVLLWWGHQKHGEVSDAARDRVVQRVKAGMGFIAIHSAHYSKPFKALLGTECGLGGWREDDQPERIHVVMPGHAIARGIVDFTIPKTEMYREPFAVPAPDVLVFESRFEKGEYFRSGCVWTCGKGRVFYFRPGHETQPIMHDPNVRKILHNAVMWAARSV